MTHPQHAMKLDHRTKPFTDSVLEIPAIAAEELGKVACINVQTG